MPVHSGMFETSIPAPGSQLDHLLLQSYKHQDQFTREQLMMIVSRFQDDKTWAEVGRPHGLSADMARRTVINAVRHLAKLEKTKSPL